MAQEDRTGMVNPRREAGGRLWLWTRLAMGLLTGALCVLRFCYLAADFPNDSPWMIDQAKFTDEGWWGGAAVMHVLTGHWYLPGDYNPAAALPVWPALLGAVLHFTGVSIVAARALNVAISIATLGVVYFLVRRFSTTSSDGRALLAVLLLSASPFAFAFSRLAILDTLVIFEFCLALLAASTAASRRLWPLIAVSMVVTSMLLTKTTSAMLLAAIFWMVWCAKGRRPGALLPTFGAVVVAPAALLKGYAVLVGAMGYGGDYKYFFAVNAMPEIDWQHTLSTLLGLLANCLWIDRVLYPAALLVLAVALTWKRKLWSNPLFTASWLAIAAHGAFIFSRQDDYAPRYFLVMLAPLVLIVVLAFDELAGPSKTFAERSLPVLLAAAMAGSAIANVVTIGQFLTHRDYDFRDAAEEIQRIVRNHPEQKALLLGVSGNQISLMTGIPSINDGFGTEEMAEKVAHYEPGWYLAWNDVASESEEILAPYRLEKMASFTVFDDDERNILTIYKLVRREGEGSSGAR